MSTALALALLAVAISLISMLIALSAAKATRDPGERDGDGETGD